MSSDSGEKRRPRGGRRWPAPLATAVLVVVVGGGTTLAVRAGNHPQAGSGSPAVPVLHLSQSGAGSAQQAPLRPGVRPITGGSYRLTGTLPAGGRRGAPVFQFAGGRAPMALVGRLASALGLSGTPAPVLSGWRLASGERELTVQDGPGWLWQLVGPAGQVRSHPACPPNGCSGPGAADAPVDAVAGLRSPRAPSAIGAQRTAARVLRATGLPADNLRSTNYGSVVEVRTPLRVTGTEAAGLDTVVTVDGWDRVVSGSGLLGRPRAGVTYPLIGAAQAFRRLQAQPRPMFACLDRCPATRSSDITGARLGWLATSDGRGSLLVPAWLFTAAGQQQPIPVVAVESRYLSWSSASGPAIGSGRMHGGPAAPATK